MSNLLPVSRKKILLLSVIAGILLIYCLFPRYLMNFGGYNYKIMDDYAKDYFIECGGHMLLRKRLPRLSEEDKIWLRNNSSDIYLKRVKRFDGEGVYLKLMSQENWIDNFQYTFSRFDDNGELESDVYESITEYNGRCYHFEYDYPFRGICMDSYICTTPRLKKLNTAMIFTLSVLKQVVRTHNNFA